MVGARGFEPPTPWSRTEWPDESKALSLCRLRLDSLQKPRLSWATSWVTTVGLLSRQKEKRSERDIVSLAQEHGLTAERTWHTAQAADPAERASDVLIAGRRSKPGCQIVRAAIYARVSTAANQSVEMQLRDLRELAARRGLEIVKEYCDVGVSGAKKSRPALDKMLADAEAGKFSLVLVWKLDRLGRSLVHLVRLMEDFRRLGMELVSFSEGLDFTTTTGKLLYQIICAFAEFERNCIRERVLAGMRNARAKGKRIGRPPRAHLSPEPCGPRIGHQQRSRPNRRLAFPCRAGSLAVSNFQCQP